MTPPADIDETTAGLTEKRVWENEVDAFVKRKGYLAENNNTLYSVVWGQCSEPLCAKLEALSNYYEAISTEADGIAHMKAIKQLVYN
jgi:hypothetical protein